MVEVQPFIYINGFPGVGKLTIATELQKLLPSSKVINNHLLIDTVAAIHERSDPEYQPLRKALRQELLKSIAMSPSTKITTWIFTDQQSSDQLGQSVAREYEIAARLHGAPFVSIVLTCGLEENRRRLVSGRRGDGSTTKLTDITVLEQMRQGANINRFGYDTELVLDVTSLSPDDSARRILAHLAGIAQ